MSAPSENPNLPRRSALKADVDAERTPPLSASTKGLCPAGTRTVCFTSPCQSMTAWPHASTLSHLPISSLWRSGEALHLIAQETQEACDNTRLLIVLRFTVFAKLSKKTHANTWQLFKLPSPSPSLHLWRRHR